MLTAQEGSPVTKSESRMSLRVYNTLSKTKEPFEPVTPGKVGIYLCGPTVYKPSHIGHMVGPVIFDAIKRYLVYNGYQVTLVVNITDVDDKLINESKARGMPMSALADEMTADYHGQPRGDGHRHDRPLPRATDNIDEIIKFIEKLVDKGFAYASDGDVYFDVASDAEYGKLSNRDVDSMQGEGGDMAERKRSPADFALWKSAKPGEPSWDSPWGKGRPGWHIECSAMSRTILGETFDIHGGGLDLVFPHHENEIAQSECCHGKPLAKYWMHNGLMQASDEVGKVGGRNTREIDAGDQQAQEAGKISKSKGASAVQRAAQQPCPRDDPLLPALDPLPPADRLQRRRGSKRSTPGWNRSTASSSATSGSPARASTTSTTPRAAALAISTRPPTRCWPASGRASHPVPEAMDDDFNTGGAVGDLFELVRTLNKFVDDEKLEGGKPSAEQMATLRRGASTLARTGRYARPVPHRTGETGGRRRRRPGRQADGAADRAAGRGPGKKDFATADRIRQVLGELGVTLEDRPGGTEWTQK